MISQQGTIDDDEFDQDDDVMSGHGSVWENEESRLVVSCQLFTFINHVFKRRILNTEYLIHHFFWRQDPNEAQYSLKWKNHQNNMIEVFNRLLGDEQLTDVLIAAEGRKIRAHKVLLFSSTKVIYFISLYPIQCM